MSSSPVSLHTPEQVAERRAPAPHTSMFVRMIVRAAVLRRRRAAAALLAMVVASAVATAMLNLYVDVQAKLRTEFRSYGANIVVLGKNDGKDSPALPPDALARIESALGPKTLAVPFSYIVARTRSGQSVVVAGADFARARQLNHWWKVSRWPDAQNQALMGMRAATAVAPNRQPFELTFQGKAIELAPTGMLQTGAAEDSRIYLDRSEFEKWTGVAPSTIEIAVNGTAAEVETSIRQLAQILPTAEVRPVRQIMEGEANVLNKTRATLYASSALVILTSALCVLATLIGWVFDRRRDFAIMKALGASQGLVNAFFAAEAAAMGVVGAMAGFLIGIGVAVWIGRVNFHAPVVPRFSVFPYVLAGSIVVALISAVVPIGMLRRVQPAMILRGE